MGQTYMKNGYIVTMGNPETVYDGGGILIDDDILNSLQFVTMN